MNSHSGLIIYRGPSLLTGAPIVAVVIVRSENEKTGSAAQSYILADNGERPTDAMRSGADAAICGDCRHRFLNARTCYVVVRQGATKVWMALQAGVYPDFTGCVDVVSEVLHGRMLRLGTYGDPAAVPAAVWRGLLPANGAWIGYTHAWRQALAAPLRDICMASVDSPAEYALARSMGWRTFRVRAPGEAPLPREAVCPASEEAGHKLTCDQCGYCDGAGRGRRGGATLLLHGNHREHREARFNAYRLAEART